ncbi:flagellar hook-associated protein 2 [Oceanobacillus piezotolerans]|uniref:Flagellar hook-associated protein 2 n=2 Tax=Oceanobacillus piezotolerans TaxID=2448030 RepID=A0A498DKV4_9BACI|nr:flagellar hook-associated protein 2 [Oceanobacillus piezotolerans]
MRIGGLASGIDTDTIIKDLMKAERIPLDKLEQDKTILEWQRDKFREINTIVAELDKMLLDMQLTSTYSTKKASSSMESAVTASGNASAGEGTYRINVTQLASSAINFSQTKLDRAGLNEAIQSYIDDPANLNANGEVTFSFFSYGEADEENNIPAGMQERIVILKQGDTIDDVASKINAADNNVRAFFDENSGRFMIETKRTGNYNTDENLYGGKEIGFNNTGFFNTVLKLDYTKEQGGEDAEFSYNGVSGFKSKDNSYTMNGITFQFTNETNGDAVLTLNNDVDAAVEKITEFVDKYNELIELLNETQTEEKYRDYPPLTDAQRDDMEEKEIELWEEKAKSGILRGDSIISSALFTLRQGWFKTVGSTGAFDLITDIGISTTRDYLDGGKLEINEDKLKEALQKDAESVYKLFAGEGETKGLIDHLDESLGNLESQIERRAGKSTDSALDNYTIGRRMDDLNDRIDAFEDRLTQTEDRYWRQFSAMEKAISMMNQQSAMLMSFGQ